jgi:Uma2 family endonuclease
VFVRGADLHIIHDRRINGVPALLVEVLSPTNPDTDLRIKRGAYARAGVPEYWIVRPATRDLLLCSLPDDTMDDYAQVQHVAPDAELVSPTLTLRARVAGFFEGAPDTTP